MRANVMIAIAMSSLLLAAGGSSNGVSVVLTRGKHGTQVVHGEFTVPASLEAVWGTLTDYDALPGFVPSVVESRLQPGPVVEQTLSGSVGPFRKEVHVALALDVDPRRRIGFQDYSGRSFTRYDGAWEVETEGDRCRVAYDLEAKPKFFSPGLLAGPAMRNGVAELLSQVRAEIIRREHEGVTKWNSLD